MAKAPAMTALWVALGCGARTELEIGGVTGEGGDPGEGGGGGIALHCDHEGSWGDRLGSAEDLESSDALAVTPRCATYIAGDVSSGLFLRGYDDSGAMFLDRSWGDGEGELIRGLAVDPNEDLVVAAQVWGSIDFGGGALASEENWDMVLASLGADGSHRWSKIYTGPDYQEASAVAVGASGEILLGGEVAGPIDFGGGVLTPAGSWDIALARFDGDGQHQASRLVGDAEVQLGPQLAATDGGWYAAGFFTGVVDFGGTPYASVGDDSYVVLLDDALTLEAGVHVTGSGAQRVEGVAATADGAIAVGHFTDGLSVARTTLDAVGARDAFALKMTRDGGVAWVQGFGGDGEVWADAVSVGPQGAVWIAGHFKGTLDIGGLPISSEDAHFVLRLAASGAVDDFYSQAEGVVRAGTPIAAMPNGGYALAGALMSSLSFDATLLQSAGGSDAFVARYRR